MTVIHKEWMFHIYLRLLEGISTSNAELVLQAPENQPPPSAPWSWCLVPRRSQPAISWECWIGLMAKSWWKWIDDHPENCDFLAYYGDTIQRKKPWHILCWLTRTPKMTKRWTKTTRHQFLTKDHGGQTKTAGASSPPNYVYRWWFSQHQTIVIICYHTSSWIQKWYISWLINPISSSIYLPQTQSWS